MRPVYFVRTFWAFWREYGENPVAAKPFRRIQLALRMARIYHRLSVKYMEEA